MGYYFNAPFSNSGLVLRILSQALFLDGSIFPSRSPSLPPTLTWSPDTASDKLTKLPSGFGSGTFNTNNHNSPDISEIEHIDLADDNTTLAEALQKQRVEQVKAQQAVEPAADAPLRLSNLTCVICMDTPKDITATACGRSPIANPAPPFSKTDHRECTCKSLKISKPRPRITMQ